MDEMWTIVKQARLKTTGINHWVYFASDRMFVAIEVRDCPRTRKDRASEIELAGR
jgi:hypothetical protein